MLKQRLGKFGLKIAESKSRIIEFGRNVWQRVQKEGKKVATVDFLGFTHYCDKTRYVRNHVSNIPRKGKFKLGRKTSKRKIRQKVKEMKQWLKGVRNLVKIEEWWQVLRVKLIGHYRYYGISGNIQGLKTFYT